MKKKTSWYRDLDHYSQSKQFPRCFHRP